MTPEQELQALESLLSELLSGIQEVLQSGEILTDEFQSILAQELTYLTDRIDEIRSENPIDDFQPNDPVPKLDQGPFPSSNVNAFKYDPKTQQLFVKFHGKDTADSGPIYQYGGVPKYIYDVFSKGRVAPKTSGANQYHRWIEGVTPSLGASLYALIRNGGYAYQRRT